MEKLLVFVAFIAALAGSSIQRNVRSLQVKRRCSPLISEN